MRICEVARVYADKPKTIDDDLEDNIRRVIANVRPQMLKNVIENSRTFRLDYVRNSRGGQIPKNLYLNYNAEKLSFE